MAVRYTRAFFQAVHTAGYLYTHGKVKRKRWRNKQLREKNQTKRTQIH